MVNKMGLYKDDHVVALLPSGNKLIAANLSVSILFFNKVPVHFLTYTFPGIFAPLGA